MKKLKISLFTLGVLVWGVSCNSSGTENTATTDATAETSATEDTASTTDTNMAADAALDTTSFPIVAASSDMFEISSSSQAQSKAVNADVKKFAGQMVTDHNKTTAELKTIAGSKNITLPTAPLPKHQKMIETVSAGEANSFDKAYMDAQVKAHTEAVTLFDNASKNEADPELKAFASKHLPHLKMHLEMAQKTQSMVK